MARAGARSQRLQPSQSQPGGSQSSQSQHAPRGTQRRRARAEEDGEEEEDDDEEEGDENANAGADTVDLVRKANDLVRLALFNEQKRLPLRRDEISKKVLGSKSRRFGEILAIAQGILDRTFGMQLVELHHVQADEPAKDSEKSHDKNAVGMKKKAAPTGTKTWVLRSTLDAALIELAVAPDADILRVEQENRLGMVDEDNDDEGPPSTDTGAIIAWQSSDQLGTVGILYTVLSLILVHGRAISDNDLRRLTKRLRLPLMADVPLNNRTPNTMTVDAFLTQCIRQGYLDRQRIGDVKAGGNKKRGRGPAATQRGAAADDEGITWEWKWGPRAMAEVGEASIAEFIAEFMVDSSLMQGEEDDVPAMSATARTKALNTMVKGVERASGGNLLSIK